VAECVDVVRRRLETTPTQGFARGDAPAVGSCVFETAVHGADTLAPAHDAVCGGVVGVGEAGSAVARCDGVGAAEHLAGEGGVVVATEAFLVGAVLAEDRDVAHVVGGDDDVATRMRGASDVGWGLSGFAEGAKVGGHREAGVGGSVVGLTGGFG